MGDRFRYGKGSQLQTIGEGVVFDGSNGIRQRDGSQAGTVSESAVPDACDGIWQVYGL